MIPLLTAEEMRTLDAHAIAEAGVPGAVLMETAGRAVFEHLWSAFGERLRTGDAAVVCGRGNNGGDGFVVARCLLNRGCRVHTVLLGSRDGVSGDAAVHLRALLGSGGAIVEIGPDHGASPPDVLRRSVLVVDAVLGTGLTADVRGLPARAIGWLNGAGVPVVSVDIPSGVSSDTGQVCGDAVRADLTVTFEWPKRGHHLQPGAALRGRLEVVEIGIPRSTLGTLTPGLWAMEPSDARGRLGRDPAAHKGVLGHVVVFGGSPGKEGAPGLAAWGALRAGAGLATVSAPAGALGAARLPLEVMTEPLGSGGAAWSGPLWEAAGEIARRADALVVGPGLGTSPGAAEFLSQVLQGAGAPVVLDADGLNLLARDPALAKGFGRPVVLTPHPGEAARLLGVPAAQIQADRPAAAAALSARYGCPVVLKGAGTLVSAPGAPTALVPLGNAGMATAGSGDVLAGVLGAFLARGMAELDAARLAAWVHASAGDLAAGAGLEGMVASDLVAALPGALRALEELGN